MLVYMDLTAYQIFAPLVAFIAVTYAWNLVFRQKKTVWEAFLWTIFWISIAYIALVPGSIDYITRVTGIQDRENAVVVTFIGILFFVVFYLIIRLEELEQRQAKMIRKIALRDFCVGNNEESTKTEDRSSNNNK